MCDLFGSITGGCCCHVLALPVPAGFEMCYWDFHGVPKCTGSPWFATVRFVAIHSNDSFEKLRPKIQIKKLQKFSKIHNSKYDM